MCIRDRSDPTNLGGIDEIKFQTGLAIEAIVVEEDKLQKACLLYTSDAADERSSVDLGGRRIIKKKKENNNM